MPNPPRRYAPLLALLLALPVMAQQDTPAAQITVNGKKAIADDPRNIVTARSRVLSRKLGASCNFMSGYSANDDDVTLRYMRDFNLDDSMSNPSERIDEASPLGNVAKITDATSVEDPAPVTDAMAPAVKCGNNDLNFAAGRNRIERKDKSMAQALAALDREDYTAALALFNTAYTKLGKDEAALMLGKMHLHGLGTPKDPAQARTWLLKIIDMRYHPVEDRLVFDPAYPELMNARVEAAMLLAKMAMAGIGGPRSAGEAARWYGKAADYGFVPATTMLGMAALSGFGGPKNAARARDLFREAAEAGYVPAQYQLGQLYYDGAPGIGQDYRQAGAWFMAAAKAGHAGALYGAARMYDLGHGVAADPQRALALYKQAAVKGQPDAESALATYFYEGQLVKQDYATARQLFNAAATQGQADAMFNLAVMLAEGQGGPKDAAMAYVWLNLAKSSGHASAGAALKELAPGLTAQDKARADAILQPAALR